MYKQKSVIMAKKTETPKEKVEYKMSVPIGFVQCVVLKPYEDHLKGEELVLVERRYKSLAARGFVK